MSTRRSTKHRRKRKQKTPRRDLRKVLRRLGGLSLLALVVGIAGLLHVYRVAPLPSLRDTVAYTPFNSNDVRTTGLRAEGLTPLSAISPYVVLSVLASEDRKFASHGGFDVGETSIAVYQGLLHGRKLRGASTISQQLVRNVFLSHQRSLRRKLREAIYTVKLERSFDKAEILALYLDVAQLGVGIYGVREASKRYFDKSPQALDLQEAILLAALLPDPERRSEFLTRGSTTSLSRTALERRLFKIHSVLDFLERERPGEPLVSVDLLQLRLAPIIDRDLPPASRRRIARAASNSLRTIVSRHAGSAILAPGDRPSS